MTKVHKICVDLCAYGGARDPSVILTSVDTFRPLSRRCLGKCPHHKHAPLVSQFRRTLAIYVWCASPQEFRSLRAHLVLSRCTRAAEASVCQGNVSFGCGVDFPASLHRMWWWAFRKIKVDEPFPTPTLYITGPVSGQVFGATYWRDHKF